MENIELITLKIDDLSKIEYHYSTVFIDNEYVDKIRQDLIRYNTNLTNNQTQLLYWENKKIIHENYISGIFNIGVPAGEICLEANFGLVENKR